MKNFASFILLCVFGTQLVSCTAPSEPAPLSNSAEAYFFQPDVTFQYTYLHDNSVSTDPTIYQAGFSSGNYLKLEQKDPSASNNTILFYFKSNQSPDGSVVCILANSPADKGLIALKGTLDLGVTWYADSAQTIEAFWNAVKHVKPLSVGLNCSLGPDRPPRIKRAHFS